MNAVDMLYCIYSQTPNYKIDAGGQLVVENCIMKKFFLSLLFAFNISLVLSQTVNIIPQPVNIAYSKPAGFFTITANTQFVVHGTGQENSIFFLRDYMKEYYGLNLMLWKDSPIVNTINLNFERMDHPIPGAYTIEVNKDGIWLNGDNENGVFYAVQTLLQLLPTDKTQPAKIPYMKIKDYPRFEYRGLHLDVADIFFQLILSRDILIISPFIR